MIALLMVLGVAGIAAGGWIAVTHEHLWWLPLTLAALMLVAAAAWRRRVVRWHELPPRHYRILDEELPDEISPIEQEMLRAHGGDYRIVIPPQRLNGRKP